MDNPMPAPQIDRTAHREKPKATGKTFNFKKKQDKFLFGHLSQPS